MHLLFVSCPKFVEDILATELTALGAQEVKIALLGVYARADLKTALRICLESRVASRVFLVLSRFNVQNRAQLYEAVRALDWQEHFTVKESFAVDCTQSGSCFRDSMFPALVVKDAVCDYFYDRKVIRPDVNKNDPQIRIHLYIHRDEAVISLDLSGQSLHRRGYRPLRNIIKENQASLKENTAAAVLYRAGWKAGAPWRPFLDPMCGSGTLLIEAALMALNIAPGLLKTKFGFFNWQGFEVPLWQELIGEARQRKAEVIAGTREVRFWGCDQDAQALRAAAESLQRCGLSRLVCLEHIPLESMAKLISKYPTLAAGKGLMAVNPPYGERLDEELQLVGLYQTLGRLSSQYLNGWQLSVLTYSEKLAAAIGLKVARKNVLFNGPLSCQLFHYELNVNNRFRVKEQGGGLSPGAQMFSNRIAKNKKALKKYLSQNQLANYRLYDRDMPEYNVSVDIYAGAYAVVAEFKPPPTVDEGSATRRLEEILAVLPQALELTPEHIFLKQRRRQAPREQYTRLAGGREIIIEENGYSFLVNLAGYIDTGIFLDTRPVRELIGRLSAGKSFLNLFAYTGTATVYAAAGGARKTLSVDASPTYARWARRNFQLNRLVPAAHEYAVGDCLAWADQNRQNFDLIYLDPPTFSNSQARQEDFDLQRDHPDLLLRIARFLNPAGTIIFSGHAKKFALNREILEKKLDILDISENCTTIDFKRNKFVHFVFKLTVRPGT